MAWLQLLRIRQWYKNLVVFLPLLFVGMLFESNALRDTLIGFLILSFVSSANYILNDIIDLQADKKHPEKRLRPLASGTIGIGSAIGVFILLLAVAITSAQLFSAYFSYAIAGLFISTLLYSLFLKNEPFVDILLISINFVLRAVSGTFIINVAVSPWLILCPFFLALFLATGKRIADNQFLGKKAALHKPVLQYYSKEISSVLLTITATCTILCYSLYAFLNNKGKLIFTLPFAVYVILRYTYLINSGSEISRHPEKAYKDIRLVASILAWIVLTIAILYI